MFDYWKMDNSIKNGAVSGLIAGIVSGIVSIFSALFNFRIGLAYYYLPPPPETPITRIALVELTIVIIWGILAGVIYSRAYDVIPTKGILKGLIFGLFCHLIMGIRTASFLLPYGIVPLAKVWLIAGFPTWIVYGLLIGLLYEILLGEDHDSKKRLKVLRFDVKNGMFTGAIAGILAGITGFVTVMTTILMGIWAPILFYEPLDYLRDIGFLAGQCGTHVFIHLIWGIIFGIIFTKVFNLIPGKSIVKGFCYGFIIYLFAGFHIAVLYMAYDVIYAAIIWGYTDFCALAVYGIVLGYLYKK